MKFKIKAPFAPAGDQPEAIKELVKDTMESAITLLVPLVADESVGKTWYEAK